MSTNLVYAIILAAGESSRLGSPKQLLTWQGKSLLEHAITHARTVFDERVIFVLGANAELIQNRIPLNGITPIINTNWQEGMAASIRTGIETLPPRATAALIMLCDQPLITATHLAKLVQAWQNAPNQIVASQYHKTTGVPALFPAEFFGQLLTIKGDSGAKLVLAQLEERIIKIAMPEAEFDIDRPDDVDQLNDLCSL
jgi:molybdenum cofactor cytidylyltransferase